MPDPCGAGRNRSRAGALGENLMTKAGLKIKKLNRLVLGALCAVRGADTGSKPNFASKYSLESSRRDLHNALLCTVLESFSNLNFFVKNC